MAVVPHEVLYEPAEEEGLQELEERVLQQRAQPHGEEEAPELAAHGLSQAGGVRLAPGGQLLLVGQLIVPLSVEQKIREGLDWLNFSLL